MLDDNNTLFISYNEKYDTALYDYRTINGGIAYIGNYRGKYNPSCNLDKSITLSSLYIRSMMYDIIVCNHGLKNESFWEMMPIFINDTVYTDVKEMTKRLIYENSTAVKDPRILLNICNESNIDLIDHNNIKEEGFFSKVDYSIYPIHVESNLQLDISRYEKAIYSEIDSITILKNTMINEYIFIKKIHGEYFINGYCGDIIKINSKNYTPTVFYDVLDTYLVSLYIMLDLLSYIKNLLGHKGKYNMMIDGDGMLYKDINRVRGNFGIPVNRLVKYPYHSIKEGYLDCIHRYSDLLLDMGNIVTFEKYNDYPIADIESQDLYIL